MLRRILFALSFVVIAGCFHAQMPPAPPPVNIVACPAVPPLSPAPDLPTSVSTPCPAGSKLEICFDKKNADAADADFDLLVKDRDYCRNAYEDVRNR